MMMTKLGFNVYFIIINKFTYVLGVQKSSELFFVTFNLYSYVIVRKWLAA